MTTTAHAAQAADIRMPDGQDFPLWDDTTVYRRTYVVAQAHPAASDDNPGTPDRPFATIDRAAQVVAPGERVLVKSGVYRERVAPQRGGTGPDSMIAYEAAPGHRVVITGARVLPPEWEPSTDPHGEDFSFRIWQMALPGELFPYQDRPFATPNASNAEIDLMPWALRWKDRVPYTLSRGLVFQDGERLTQLAAYEDLVRLPGSYWVDPAYCVLHVHPLGDVHPNDATFEVTVQEQLFRPAEVGLGYIKVKGFIFERAGNGFPRIGVGAVYVHGGHHWIIEDTIVRACNSVGIEAGAAIAESQVSTPEERARVREHPGGFILRRNTVYDCGTGGIEGFALRDSRIEDNHIYDIGWQDVERYWECAAIKTLINDRTLVRGNLIHNVTSASAIWLDWDNRTCRITRNIIIDVREAHNGAVFIEASQRPNWIDHNVIWGAWEPGVNLSDTDQVLVCHNLIAHTAVPVVARVATDRSLHGRRLTSRDNAIVANIFLHNEDLPVLDDAANVCDHNLYGDEHERPALTGRLDPDWDANSTAVSLWADLDLDLDRLELTLEIDAPMPAVPATPASAADFFGQPAGDTVAPGPFDETFAGTHVARLR